MKRIYVIVGELEDTDQIDTFYGACHTMKKADELCLQAENEIPGHIFYWREVIEEDD
jgi:hypothetical protein